MTSEVKRPVTFQLRSSRNPTADLLSVYQGNQKIGIRKPACEFLCFSPALYLSRTHTSHKNSPNSISVPHLTH